MLTGGGKDRKIILWDHDLRPDRDIEVGHSRTLKCKPLLFGMRITSLVRPRVCRQVPDQYGTIRAVSEGKGDEFLVGTSRNFILRGTFNDGFLGVVQVRSSDVIMTSV